MRIIVTGSKGQLGSDLVSKLEKYGHEVIGVDKDNLDITDRNAVFAFVSDIRPDSIIHAAAWTAVDSAEDNPAECSLVNASGTKNIADAAATVGASIFYLSTDYVFPGTGLRPWRPEDTPLPCNVYGKTKYEGELAVKAATNSFFIVRISWVFGLYGKNFIKTMLRLGLKNKEIKVVNDQIGSPTFTEDLSSLIAAMISTDKYGIYHASNEGYCSWYDLAEYTFRTAVEYGMTEYSDVHVLPVSSNEYPVKAERPKNSRMEKSKLSENGFIRLPEWKDAVRRFVKELKENPECR